MIAAIVGTPMRATPVIAAFSVPPSSVTCAGTRPASSLMSAPAAKVRSPP